MSAISGINIPASVVPYDTADTNSTHQEQYGQGGFRTVANNTERNAIVNDRCKAGMIVYNLSNGKLYQLIDGFANPLTDADWVDLGVESATKEDVTYYIDPAGNDTTGDGSAGNPWRTLQYVWEYLPGVINHDVVINCGAGTYYETNDILIGKKIGTGSFIVYGEVNVVADAGGTPFVCTGGSNVNVNGYGEFVVSGAGWSTDAYAGMFVRIITSTGPSDTVYIKYFPIHSNTADTLHTSPLNITPNANTTFDIVKFDSHFTSATAAAPTVGINRIFIFDNSSQAYSIKNDGLYSRKAITFDGISLGEAITGGQVHIYISNIHFRGVRSHTVTHSLQSFYTYWVGSNLTLQGFYMSGNVGEIIKAANRCNVVVNAFRADYSTYTGSATHYTFTCQRGSYVDGSLGLIEGRLGHLVTAAAYSRDNGSIVLLNYVRIDLSLIHN